MVVFALQVGAGPVVKAASVLFGNLRIHARFVFQFERTVGGNIHIDFFVERDVALVEFVVRPELSRSERGMNHGDDVVFQHFARTEAWHRNMLLAIVGIDRRLLLQGSAEILHGVVAGFHDAAVGLDYADVVHFNSFVGGVIAN